MDIPVIVVTDEFRALVEIIDFTQMTDDEFGAWLSEHATARVPVELLGGPNGLSTD